MDDTVSMEMLHSREHLTHDVSCVPLGELLGSDDPVEELAALAVLHHDVHVAMVDVALVKLDNVWVIHFLENGQLLLEQPDVFCNVLAKNGFDGVCYTWVRLESGRANGSEVSTTDHLNEVVNCAHISL